MSILTFLLGTSIITVAPLGTGFFSGWGIEITDSYGLSIFEGVFLMVSLPVLMARIVDGKLKIHHWELQIFEGFILLTFSRVVSLVFAGLYESGQFMSAFRFVMSMLTVYVVALLAESSANGRMLVAGIVAGSLIESFGGIAIFILTGEKGILWGNATYPLQVFVIISCLLYFLQGKLRVPMLLGTTFFTFALFASMSRSSLIFLVSTLVVFSILMVAKGKGIKCFRNIALYAIFVAAAYAAAPTFQETVTNRVNDALQGGSSIAARFYLWDKAAASFFQHPITGIGSGSFSRNMVNLPQWLAPEADLDMDAMDGLSGHNMILEVLAETGIVGFAAYVFFVISVVAFFWKFFKDIEPYRDVCLFAAMSTIGACFISDSYGRNGFGPASLVLLGYVIGTIRSRASLFEGDGSETSSRGALTSAEAVQDRY